MAGPVNSCPERNRYGYTEHMAEEWDKASAKRVDAARAFRRHVAEHPEIRDRIPENVIVVLPEDHIGAVFDYLDKHYPGKVSLACINESQVRVISVQMRKAAEPHMSKLTVAPESEIGMLFYVLGYKPDQPFEIAIESPDFDDLLQAERLTETSLTV